MSKIIKMVEEMGNGKGHVEHAGCMPCSKYLRIRDVLLKVYWWGARDLFISIPVLFASCVISVTFTNFSEFLFPHM